MMEHQKLPSYNFNDRPVIRFGEAVKETLKMSPDRGWWSEINIMVVSIKFINVTMSNWISSCTSYKILKLYIAVLKGYRMTPIQQSGVKWQGKLGSPITANYCSCCVCILKFIESFLCVFVSGWLATISFFSYNILIALIMLVPTIMFTAVASLSFIALTKVRNFFLFVSLGIGM